jgi:Rps23 Pro-64 3,4-dihydroxylase Tpa1-like proline 4-hydroxylase
MLCTPPREESIDGLLADEVEESIIEIALRKQSRVLLFGQGPLMDRISAEVTNKIPEVEQAPFPVGMLRTTLMELESRYKSAQGFPITPHWDAGQEIDASAFDDPNSVRMAIVIAENVPYDLLFQILARFKQSGSPVLPITFSHRGIEIGPLLLDQTLGALAASRFGLASEMDVPGHPVGLFSTGSFMPVCDHALDVASALVVRIVSEPHQNDWLRWAIVRPDGLIEELAVRRNNSTAFKRLSGSIWDLRNYLDESVADDVKMWELVGSEIRRGALISIKNALRKDFTECIHRTLWNSNKWKLYEGFREDFFFHHHNIYDKGDLNATLVLANLIFNSEGTVQWIGVLTGLDCSETVTASPSWYMCGDHSTPHSDFSDNRRVAFVWHLTKDWSRDWGGHLVWCSRGGHLLPPSFNTLNLFDTRQGQNHFVMTVAPHARGKRLAWNGWWRGNAGSVRAGAEFDRSELPLGDRVRIIPPG